MSGREFGNAFTFLWPTAKIAVMGGEQIAVDMSMVRRATSMHYGIPIDEKEDAKIVEGQKISHDKGSEALITVSATNGTGMLFLNNVQGEEFTSGQPIVVYEGSTATSYGSTEITSSAVYDAKYEGNVIEVNHFNHGMQADNNLVTLADVEPDTIPVLLTDSLSVDGQTISVASTSEFVTYNGISTSQGYVKINNEIIFYNSIGTNQLGIGTRGVDGTIPRTHDTGDKANKYELNGFDLRCINTDHSMVLMGQEINDLKTEINLQKDQVVSLRDDVVKLKVEVKMLSDEAKDFNEYVQIMVHTNNLDHATEDQHKKIKYLNSIHYVS